MKQKISFSPPDITDMEIAAVEEVLRSGWITTGAKVKELEGKLADFLQVHKVVCLASATSAEELIFRILGIGPGDEVIVPAYTYTASAAAAIHVGAKVVFVDAQLGSTEMDYEQLETAITPATKAIVSVDLGGVLLRQTHMGFAETRLMRGHMMFGMSINQSQQTVVMCVHSLCNSSLVTGLHLRCSSCH